MSNLIFKLETLNPKLRATFFKHKVYTNYLANSEYAIKNKETNHGLFGRIEQFKDIRNMESIEEISQHISELANRKVPIYRGLISLNEYDACRLGYLEQEKWQELLESKLPSIAKKINVKYEDLQYVGAVHLEEGHPHFQFMLWSKAREKSNYFIKYQIKNKLRIEFTNEVFKEDLLPIYQEKDLAKKNIIAENEILNKLKLISQDETFIKNIMNYEKGFKQNKLMKKNFKNEELKSIVGSLINLKEDLRKTKGSIKYQYLNKYPEIIEKVDSISNEIIKSSIECKEQIDKYIKAKQKLLEFKYSNEVKLKEQMQKTKEETEKEVLKLVGNKILDFERKLLNTNEEYTEYRYFNETRYQISNIYNFLCSLSHKEENKYNMINLKYKKQLSKQAKKEKAIEKRNSSSWDWNQ